MLYRDTDTKQKNNDQLASEIEKLAKATDWWWLMADGGGEAGISGGLLDALRPPTSVSDCGEFEHRSETPLSDEWLAASHGPASKWRPSAGVAATCFVYFETKSHHLVVGSTLMDLNEQDPSTDFKVEPRFSLDQRAMLSMPSSERNQQHLQTRKLELHIGITWQIS